MKPKLELALSVLTYDGRPPKRALSARVVGDTCVIGRHASCQLELPDPDREISGRHVLIYRQDGGFSVTDVSTNGTFLNDAEDPLDPSQAVDLRHGDRLTIGRYVVEVTFAQAAGTPSPAEGVAEPSAAPDPAPVRSACPDILDLIGPAPTEQTGEALEGQGAPTTGAATEQLTVVPAALLKPGTEHAKSDVAGADSGGLPAGDAGSRHEPPEDEAAGDVAPATPAPFSAPDPADVPTTLVPLQDEPAQVELGAEVGQGMPPPHGPGSELPVRSSGETPPVSPASAQAAPVAADAPTQILPMPDLPGPQSRAEEERREPVPPRKGAQEQPEASREGDPAGLDSVGDGQPRSGPAEGRAAASDTAEVPRASIQSRDAVPREVPSAARPRSLESRESMAPPATPAAPPLHESGVDAARAGEAGSQLGDGGSVSPDAPTLMLKVDAAKLDPGGRAEAGGDPESRGAGSDSASSEPPSGVPSGEQAAVPPVQMDLRRTAQRTTAPGPALDASDAAAKASPREPNVSPAATAAPSVGSTGAMSGEAAGASRPSSVEEGPTLSTASGARIQNPGPGDFDPGRTSEGPGSAVGRGQAPILDDATRIRAPSETPLAEPLSASELGQVEAFLAGLGVGRAEEVGDAARLMRTSGALLRTMTQGLVAASMAQEQLRSELRGGMPVAPSESGNPFGFCLDIDGTLARVLWRPGCEYLDPSAAARQAFDAMEVHQAALMAGLRAVLKALLARLEPHAIEQESGGQAGLGQLLPNARKAKCWDHFTAAFEEIADDVSEDFAKAFGDAFKHAYDDEAARLRAEKRRR